jgi:hypothetical protein
VLRTTRFKCGAYVECVSVEGERCQNTVVVTGRRYSKLSNEQTLTRNHQIR